MDPGRRRTFTCAVHGIAGAKHQTPTLDVIRVHAAKSIRLSQSRRMLSVAARAGCLPTEALAGSATGSRFPSAETIGAPINSSRVRCHALNCLSPRSGRVDSPEDAQAGRREADVRRRAAAFLGHQTAGSPRRRSPARRALASFLWRPGDGTRRRRRASATPRLRASARSRRRRRPWR